MMIPTSRFSVTVSAHELSGVSQQEQEGKSIHSAFISRDVRNLITNEFFRVFVSPSLLPAVTPGSGRGALT